jgi:site-specific recombinase XerD
MTAKTFLRYLGGRMDVATVGSERFVPPDKVEKPPKLVARETVLWLASNQPDTDIGWRNRALIGVLLETGMLVTEALALRVDATGFDKDGATLSITGKRARTTRVSASTAKALREVSRRLIAQRSETRYFFYGYSKAGPNAEKLTPRGVEVLFKGWAKTHELRHFHPRTLRHLFVVDCLLSGKSESEVMQLLSLRTPYAFRVYRPLVNEIKSSSETTYSASDKDQAEAPSRP